MDSITGRAGGPTFEGLKINFDATLRLNLEDSTTATTTFDLSTVIYNHGTKSNTSLARRKRRRKRHLEEL